MPITNVYYKPKIWSPGYNPIVWSFLSNQNTQTDFNYVVDVYINAATGATAPAYRLLQKPNPAGVCMVDVSSIVQPYLQLTNYSVEEGWSLDYRDSYDIAASLFLKVGEQYVGASGGALTTFDGLGVNQPTIFGLTTSISRLGYSRLPYRLRMVSSTWLPQGLMVTSHLI